MSRKMAKMSAPTGRFNVTDNLADRHTLENLSEIFHSLLDDVRNNNNIIENDN